MKKIYDAQAFLNEYGYSVCENCECSSSYYESDTGYYEITCNGSVGEDCQEAIKIFIEENELEENYEGDNKMVESNMNEMELKVDLGTLVNTITNSVKLEVKNLITYELKSEIVKMVYEEVAKPQIEEIKSLVQQQVQDMVKTEIETYYTTQKITVGGGYSSSVKEYTIQEYTQELLRGAVENGVIKASKGKYDTQTLEIDKYLLDNCISSEINKYLNDNLKRIQKDVNEKVKNVFETKVETMMSEVALGVLKSNATYNEVSKKLLG